jgi:hypothetical protein
MKLAGGCPSLAHELSVDAFLEQVGSVGGGAALISFAGRPMGHPLSNLRNSRGRETAVWNKRCPPRRRATPSLAPQPAPPSGRGTCASPSPTARPQPKRPDRPPRPRRPPQARSYDEAAASSLIGWYFSNAHSRALSHPLPVMRAREVDRWAASEEYRRLVGGG